MEQISGQYWMESASVHLAGMTTSSSSPHLPVCFFFFLLDTPLAVDISGCFVFIFITLPHLEPCDPFLPDPHKATHSSGAPSS